MQPVMKNDISLQCVLFDDRLFTSPIVASRHSGRSTYDKQVTSPGQVTDYDSTWSPVSTHNTNFLVCLQSETVDSLSALTSYSVYE